MPTPYHLLHYRSCAEMALGLLGSTQSTLHGRFRCSFLCLLRSPCSWTRSTWVLLVCCESLAERLDRQVSQRKGKLRVSRAQRHLLICHQLHFFLYRPKAFTLMRLPPELRLKIYEHLLPEDRMFHLTAGIPEATWKTHSSTQGVFRSRFPALLYVSRQVHREFQPLFYGSSTFVITIDRPKELFSALRMIEQLLPPNSINQVDVFTMMRDLRLRVDSWIGLPGSSSGSKGSSV